MKHVKPLRADGRRNRARLVAAAAELVAKHGAQVSLEEIARRAGVGSATLHRHFPSRQALLEVVFRDGVAQLCARAAALPGEEPAAELAAWLEELTVYTAANRGLSTALLTGPDAISAEELCCSGLVLEVLENLVARASSVGAIHASATAKDLMLLANAIAIANEDDPHTARRVLRLALTGIRSTRAHG
ncbi:TetR/AcrR family transcriptional regulator [Myxococcus sp. Y35]|uniref:TetR/AcrR family transcriptional regulator n=1 Tax=Pseudomyxococcus flavus TaxID=3115648 RepID=UPI003CF8E948